MSKVVAVVGGNSSQGQSVINHLLQDGHWKIRTIVRDTDKPAVKDFIQRGVEVIKGDFTKADDLGKLFDNAYAAFGVTVFYDQSQRGQEFQTGKLQADIAHEKGVQHFIFSSLVNVEKVTQGKIKVEHFTEKGKVEEYARTLKFPLTTFIGAGFYFQNFERFMKPKKLEDGTVAFGLPGFPEDGYLSMFDIQDIGGAVVTALNHPNEWNGKFVPLAGTHKKIKEIVQSYSEVTGAKAVYSPLPRGLAGAEVQGMLDWFAQYTYFGPEADLTIGKKAYPKMKSWEDWLKEGHLRL